MSKNLDPNIQPEKLAIRPLQGNEILQEKPRIGQGRAGMRRRRLHPINQTIAQTAETSMKNSLGIKNRKKSHKSSRFYNFSAINKQFHAEVINRRPIIKIIPFYPDPTYRPLPKPVRIPMSGRPENIDIISELNIDLTKILHFKKE